MIAACLDKSVKVFDGEKLIFTLQLQKKVIRMTLYGALLFIADKHGDMFQLDLAHLEGEQKSKIIGERRGDGASADKLVNAKML